jgi:hypothetical protein
MSTEPVDSFLYNNSMVAEESNKLNKMSRGSDGNVHTTRSGTGNIFNAGFSAPIISVRGFN